MPVKRCQKNDREGRKWGDAGACYPCRKTDGGWDCKEATQKALAQARAMGELENINDSDLEVAGWIEDNQSVWKDSFAKLAYLTYKGVRIFDGGQ